MYLRTGSSQEMWLQCSTLRAEPVNCSYFRNGVAAFFLFLLSLQHLRQLTRRPVVDDRLGRAGRLLLSNLPDPGIKRIILILDRPLMMARRTVPEGEPDGRIGVHVNLVRVPSTVGARRRNVLGGGNHSRQC
jgi:hypothetical protein